MKNIMTKKLEFLIDELKMQDSEDNIIDILHKYWCIIKLWDACYYDNNNMLCSTWWGSFSCRNDEHFVSV